MSETHAVTDAETTTRDVALMCGRGGPPRVRPALADVDGVQRLEEAGYSAPSE